MRGLRAIIAAVSPEGAIGKGGKIPWHHPGDYRRFKRLTTGTTIIMGRLTWESIGSRPLSKRRNLVISSRPVPNTECFRNIREALATCEGDVWFVGGTRIYEDAMRWVDVIDLTYVPEHVEGDDVNRFPPIDSAIFEPGPLLPHEDEPGLTRREYKRRAGFPRLEP